MTDETEEYRTKKQIRRGTSNSNRIIIIIIRRSILNHLILHPPPRSTTNLGFLFVNFSFALHDVLYLLLQCNTIVIIKKKKQEVGTSTSY
jgi:hypothetical protein